MALGAEPVLDAADLAESRLVGGVLPVDHVVADAVVLGDLRVGGQRRDLVALRHPVALARDVAPERQARAGDVPGGGVAAAATAAMRVAGRDMDRLVQLA